MSTINVQIDPEVIWTIYTYEIIASIIGYGVLYCLIILKCIKTGLSPKDCLSFAMNIGGIINGILAVISSIFFVIDKRWTEQVICEPKITGHIYCYITAFFIVDTIVPVIFYIKYSSKIVPHRYDMIIHHILALLPLFLVEIPNPIYAWNIMSIIPLTEITTCCLCAQWLAKYFKQNKWKQIFKISFVVTWFLIRIPCYSFMLWWMINYWTQIWNEIPLRVSVCLVTLICSLSFLQIPWSILIILKFVHPKNKNSTKEMDAHGVSLSFIDVGQTNVTETKVEQVIITSNV